MDENDTVRNYPCLTSLKSVSGGVELLGCTSGNFFSVVCFSMLWLPEDIRQCGCDSSKVIRAPILNTSIYFKNLIAASNSVNQEKFTHCGENSVQQQNTLKGKKF